jgi:hypothetical protein
VVRGLAGRRVAFPCAGITKVRRSPSIRACSSPARRRASTMRLHSASALCADRFRSGPSQQLDSSWLYRKADCPGRAGHRSGKRDTDDPPVPARDAGCCQSRPFASRQCTPIPPTNRQRMIKKA